MHIIHYVVFCYAVFGALGGFNLQKKDGTMHLKIASFDGMERVACALVAYVLRPW
jgi:hypothetical protein